MPPRTALFEIATRSNKYVCSSCSAALGISHTPQRFTRGYARQSRSSKHPRQQVSKDTEPVATPRDEPPQRAVKVNYFEKDPKTGKVTPVPGVQDDGDDEPRFADLANLARNTMGKVESLRQIFSKFDEIDAVLENFIAAKGPPGALEAYRAALRKFDDPNDNGSGLNLEDGPDPNAKAEELKGSFQEATSGSNLEDVPEIQQALRAVEEAMKSLDLAAKDKPSSTKASKTRSRAVTEDDHFDLEEDDNDEHFDENDELFEGDLFDVWSSPAEKNVPVGSNGKSIIVGDRTRHGRVINARKLGNITAAWSRVADGQVSGIWFDISTWSASQIKVLHYQREILLQQVEAWRAFTNKPERRKKLVLDRLLRCLSALSDALSEPSTKVNPEVWQELWTILSHTGVTNPGRAKHVIFLAKVMQQNGAILTNDQQMLTAESLFERGALDGATLLWKRLVHSVGTLDSRLGLAFWELGVKLWCAQGDLERAERACRSLLDRSTLSCPADMSVLLHLIQTYCTKPNKAEKGFSLYRRMRDFATELEKPMGIEDYDNVISLFLASGHTDYAMFAFTDMMFAGTIDLRGRARLPNQVRNSFFFGKWLKRLIGNGDLDDAYKVLVFMQKNGVVAASVQVNGLIGAWLRTGTVANRNKAYQMAQAMILSRESFVNLRKRESLVDYPIRFQDNRPNDPAHANDGEIDYTMVPRATIETFVIMATEYRERKFFLKLEELFVSFKKCEMPDDAMMMNELLAALVAQEKRDKVHELYKSMVHEHGLLPSTDTFAILFQSLRVNVARAPIVNNPGLVAETARQARDFFADMMRSAWIYTEKVGRRGPANPLSENQAKLILHSFRKAHDLAGLSAALMGLRDVMGYRLSRGIVLELLMDVEGIDRPTPRMGKMVINGTMRLQHFVSVMQQRGQLPADVTEEGMKNWKVLYVIVLQWFYQKMQERVMEDGQPDKLLKRAKQEMGVNNLTTTMPSD